MPIKLKKTNIQYDIDPPDSGYIILGFDENGNLVTKNSDGDYEPIINDVSTGTFDKLEVEKLTVGNRVSGSIEGDNSIAQGLNNSASGITSFAAGNNAIASSLYSYARGSNVQSTNELSYVAGKYDGAGPYKVTASGINTFVHMRSNDSSKLGSSADYSAILGGQNHNIGDNSFNSVIIGGTLNSIGASITNSVILGGQSQIATSNSTVYVPKITYKMQTADPTTENGMIFYKNDSHFYGYAGGTKVRLDNALTLTNNANNRIITATGTDDINGEANLTFDGNLLNVIGDITLSDDLIVGDDLTVNGAIYGNPYFEAGFILSNALIQISRSLTSSATPLFSITNTGASGDASMMFDCGATEYTVGVDDTDGDRFKIYYGAELGTDDTYTVLETDILSGYLQTYLHGSTHIEHERDTEPVLTIQNTNYSSDNDPALLHMIRDWNTTTTYLNYVRFYRGNGTIYDGGINVHSYTPGFINGSSDIRRKTGITMWEEDALDILNNLPVKSFYYIDDLEKTEKTTGWIAQEVQPLIPNMVIESGEVPDDDPDNPYLTIMPSTLYPYFHKSIQQLSAKITELEQRISELENPV